VRNQPPVAAGIQTVDYPAIPETLLPNGLLVLTIEDSRFPIVSVQVGFPVGRVHNTDQNLSLLQLAVESAKDGTTSRTARQIADQMDHWAIQYSSDLFMESTLHAIRVLEKHLERALDILSDVLLRPVFPEEELDKTRARWASILQAQRSQPEFLATERAYLTCFEGHPYAKNTIPLDHLLEATREGVRQSYAANYGPRGAILLFAGAITHDRSVEMARRFFGDWDSASAEPVTYPSLPDLSSKRVLLVDRPKSVQTRILVALRALAVTDPDMIALRVANQVMGGGASARLFLKLREEKGYTYGAYSRLKSYKHGGLILAGAGVRSDVTRESVDDLLQELTMMATGLPSEEELSRSRSEIIGAFIRQMETPTSIGGLELRRRLCGLPDDHYRTLPSRVQDVTPEKVREVSSRILEENRPAIIAVGDRQVIENQVNHLGEVEVFTALGQKIGPE